MKFICKSQSGLSLIIDIIFKNSERRNFATRFIAQIIITLCELFTTET